MSPFSESEELPVPLIARIKTQESCFRLTWSQHVLDGDPQASVFDGRDKLHIMRMNAPQFASVIPDDPKSFLYLGQGAFAIDGERLFETDGIDNEKNLMVYEELLHGFHMFDLRAVNRPVCLMCPCISLPSSSVPGGPPCSLKEWPAPVFRITDRSPTEIFCFDAGVPGQGGNFLRLYNAQGWKGLNFETVWEGSLADLGLTVDRFK